MNAEERCEDRHAAACAICSEGGDLLCCDACPTAVHLACVGLDAIPEVCASDCVSSLYATRFGVFDWWPQCMNSM